MREEQESAFELLSRGTLGGGAQSMIFAGKPRALSGTAAIVSGVRAEIQDAFFKGLTAQIVVDGIQFRREEIVHRIRQNQKLDLRKYPVEQAVVDALKYHDSCSLLVGLETAGMALGRLNNPTLDDTLRAVEALRTLGWTITKGNAAQ